MNAIRSCPRRRRSNGLGSLAAVLLLWTFSGATPAAAGAGGDDGAPGKTITSTQVATQAPLTADPLSWSLYRRNCSTEPTGYTLPVPCGGYGIFYFFDGPGPSGAHPCEEAGADDESPPAYNAPAKIIHTGDAFATPLLVSTSLGKLQSTGSGAGTPLGEDPNPAEQEIPCSGGSCLASQPGGQGGLLSWLGIIDWPDWHGYTVAAATQQVSGGMPIYLFSLLEDSVASLFGNTVGDGHLLVQMCHMVESSYETATLPPYTLGMSLGRTLLDGEENETAANCDKDSLPCQLKRVMDHARGEQGVELLAAAGNHGSMHFPASDPSVTSVGSLDMAWFGAKGGGLKRSWESPRGADGYMPGHGICLDYEEGLWPAPAGSSYATAILAGWLGKLQDDQGLAPPAGVWAPLWAEPEECYVLMNEPQVTCNLEANAMIERILGLTSEKCWSPVVQQPNEIVQASTPAVDEESATAGAIPLDQWVSAHQPAPEPDFCIPCSGGGFKSKSGGDFRAGSKIQLLGGGPAGGVSLGIAVPLDPGLVIDLSGYTSWSEVYYIDSMFFRVGQSFYPLLDRSDPEDAAKLDQIGNGELKSMTLMGLMGKIPVSSQPSLFYVMCEDGVGCYWSSVPILMI